MSLLLDRLNAAKNSLENRESREEYIEHVISADPSTQDELDRVISRVIELSYKAGCERPVKRASLLAQKQAQTNSDNQAVILAPVLEALKKDGIQSFQAIADALNKRGIQTKNGHIWHPSTVRLLVQKIGHLAQVGAISTLDEHTQNLILILERLQKAGVESFAAIADTLNKEGILTQGGHPWYPSTVKSLIQTVRNIKDLTGRTTIGF